MAASIDIAANCNLRCQHCYLYEKEHQEEGIDNDAAFLARVRQFRRDYPTVLQCTWVGGEPMWRQALLRKCVRLFPANWVVTNGTIPIEGEWPFTAFNISIDGTEDIHNQIRRSWKPSKLNVYQRAKQHANQAQVPVYVHTVINKMNVSVVPDLVDEWRQSTRIRGFFFSLHTPQIVPERPTGMTENDEKLFIPMEQRRDVVDMLQALKTRHGSFINMSRAEINNYLPERSASVFGDSCRMVDAVVSLDAQFKRKTPCVMGGGMDCRQCGCIIPASLERAASFDWEALTATLATVAQ